jgi:hypothetical protein
MNLNFLEPFASLATQNCFDLLYAKLSDRTLSKPCGGIFLDPLAGIDFSLNR